MNYREYEENDFEDLLHFFQKNDFLFPDPFQQHVDLKEYLLKLVKFAYIFLAFDENEIIGFAAAYMNDQIRHEAHLQLALINKNYQGKGIGRKLLKHVHEAAAEKGMKTIALVVDENNPGAQKLYTQLGYCFYADLNDRRNGKLHMRLTLNLQTIKVQNRLLEMAKSIIDIFDKNGIPYLAAFGTLLGAVRHSGFIPWDDDFDLFLFDDSYDEALECLRNELQEDMFLEYFDSEPLYFHQWAHVKDKESITECSAFPQDGIYVHKGISIDLYRLKAMQERDVEPFRWNENIKYYERRNSIGTLDATTLRQKKDEIALKIVNYKNDSHRQAFAIVTNERLIYVDDTLPLKKYQFEDISIKGPANADAILNHFYGDYMRLPDEKERVSHYSKVVFKK